jgi:hypothetical protein
MAALSSETELKTTAGVTEEQRKEEEKDAQDLLGGGSVHITRLYLGWAF